MEYQIKFGWICFLYVIINVLVPETGAYNYNYMQETCDPVGVQVNLTNMLHTYGYVKLVKSGGYNPNLDCVMYIWAPAGHRLMVRFVKIEIYKPDTQCTDVLYMSGNKTTHIFCGYGTPSYAYVSTGHMLKLQFISQSHDGMDGQNDRIGFDLYYTSFHDGDCDTDSQGDEFQCSRDSRCIPKELTCDNRDNCGDWSDEGSKVCKPSNIDLVVGVLIITLICVVIVGTCIAVCVYKNVNKKPGNRSPKSNQVQPVNWTSGNNQTV